MYEFAQLYPRLCPKHRPSSNPPWFDHSHLFLRAGSGGGGSEGAGMDGGGGVPRRREGGGPSGGGGEGVPDEELLGLWDWNWEPRNTWEWDCGLLSWNRFPWELDLGMSRLLTGGGGDGDAAPHILAASAIGSYLQGCKDMLA